MLQTAQTGWTGFSSLTPISRSEPGQTSYLQQLPVSAHLSIMAGPKPINPTIAVMKRVKPSVVLCTTLQTFAI